MKIPKIPTIVEMKNKVYRKLSKNPGTMLMHTGAIGWAASSAAQITGMAFNDKIDENKKKFLIPQECADAAGNIVLYYILTTISKKFAEGLFDYGRVRLEKVSNVIKNMAEKEGITEAAVFKESKSIPNLLNDVIKDSKLSEHFFKYRNGASVIATLAASVISCNILTPYFRNYMGAKAQKKAAERATQAKIEIFAMESKFNSNEPQKNAFKNFFV